MNNNTFIYCLSNLTFHSDEGPKLETSDISLNYSLTSVDFPLSILITDCSHTTMCS